MRRVIPLVLACGLSASGLALLAQPAAAVSPDVVLSQVYGGGGNSGAVFTRDFIQLQNRSSTAVSVDGWSVQYASASGTSWQATPLSGSIPAGGSYLIAEAAGAGGTTELPTPAVTGSIAMSATSGKVALVSTSGALACGSACATAAGVRDLVGYGTADDFEGSPAPGLSNTTAALRSTGPDTDVNSADFAAGPPAPAGGTTEPPPTGAPCATTDPVAVPAVQGSTDVSPYAGQTVTTRGVVVGDTPGLSGFFLQDPTGDGDPATSDGVFVYLPAANPLSTTTIAVGEEVALTGTVKEFNGLTELDSLTGLQKCGTLPTPAPTSYALPEPTQGDLERVEGMLVSVATPLTVQQNFFLGRYGQLTLGSGGRLFQPTNLYAAGSPEATALADANARALLVLDDGSSAQNPSPIPYLDADNTRRAGDTVTGLVGVLDYGPVSSTTSVRDYRLHPTVAPTFASSGRPATPEPVGGTLRAASFNVLNYFTTLDTPDATGDPRGANTAEEFERQRTKIFAALAGLDADVVGLIEIENNGVAAQDLVDGLNAYVGAPGRWAVVPDPANGVGTDAIKVAQIFRTDRVAPVGASLSPLDQSAFDGIGRPPVGQAYRQLSTGAVVSLVVNHFKSKGSCPTGTGPDSDSGDGQGCFNATRVAQAHALLSFVDEVATAAGDPDVLVVGDLNAYGKEDPVAVLTGGGLVNLLEREIGAGAYSYVFDGRSGYLDHALATPSLAAQVTGATEWHVNADEPSVLDYNTEFKPDDRYAPTPFRSSDHDPVLVGAALTAAAPAKADLQVSVSGPITVKVGRQVTYRLTVRNTGPSTVSSLSAALATGGLGSTSASPSGAAGSVVLNGTRVSGTRWTLQSLAAGQSATFAVTGTVIARSGQLTTALGAAIAGTPDPAWTNNLAATVSLVRS